MATITSVNVGVPRTVEWFGRDVTTAIWKDPVEGPVVLAGVNLAGDDQADRRVHGGPDKAVYAYSVEDYAWWAEQSVEVGPGTFGENLTTAGIDLTESRIGDRWTIGDVVLEVAQPREPCYKLALRMGDTAFPDRFEAAARTGAYLRIVEGGSLTAGDTIIITSAPAPSVTLGRMARGELDLDAIHFLADDPRVPPHWQKAAARALRG